MGVGRPTTLATTLLRGMFDDASLFPPAAAPMEAALALHAASGSSGWGFARGRFLVPLGALGRVASERRLLDRDDRIELGLVVGSPADPTAGSPLDDIEPAVAALARTDSQVLVRHVEYRPADQTTGGLETAASRLAALGAALELDATHLELVADTPAAMRSAVDVVAAARADDPRLHAKLRFGGLTPDLFPDDALVLAFLRASVDAGVPFKGTAGLHHAWYGDGEHRHHGYLAVLLTVLALASGADDDTCLTLLRSGDADAAGLSLDDRSLRAGGSTADLDDVAAARSRFVAFGTCSFTEPLDAFVTLAGATR